MVIVTVPLADVPSDEPPEQAETTDPLPTTATRPSPPRSRSRLDSLGACLWCTGTVSLLLLGTFPRHRPGVSAGHNWPAGVRHPEHRPTCRGTERNAHVGTCQRRRAAVLSHLCTPQTARSPRRCRTT